MALITRRRLLFGLGGPAAVGLGLGGYGFGLEPLWRMNVTAYRLSPPGWTPGLSLRLAVVADVHAGEPYMSATRISDIASAANGLGADLILLLGDYVAGHPFCTRRLANREWAEALASCRAPLGVHAVLGNHDWWDDRTAQRDRRGPIIARRELERAGIAVYENDAVRLAKDGRGFWMAGLADQLALLTGRGTGKFGAEGLDDLDGTLSKVTSDEPVILLAHEPDIFPKVPARVSLTIAGHTHGGQVRIAGYSPVVPSRYGNRYAYGHIVEEDRSLIVSGGLGCSIMPVRLGVPPEIVVVDVGA